MISAAIAAGASHRIVARWLDLGDLDVVVCPALIAEVESVLDRAKIQKRIKPDLARRYSDHPGRS